MTLATAIAGAIAALVAVPSVASDDRVVPTEEVRACFDRGDGQLTGVSMRRDVRAPTPAEIDAARVNVQRFGGAGAARGGSGVATLMDNGRSDKRIDLVFVGDGYTADELDLYHQDVDAMVEAIFTNEPFRTYRTRFNVHRVDVVSNESGVDNDPTLGVERDTALDMEFWCNGTERALCVDSTKAHAFAALAPEEDHIIAVANSSKFGGVAYFGTHVACVSARSSLMSSTLRHELGHSLFTLEDEYDYGGPATYTGPEFGRTTISIYDEAEQIERETKWWEWMGASLPGLDGPVGAYEGARYSRRGIYRPSPRSLMRSHNRPFNGPSMEQAVRAMHSVGDPWMLFENHTMPIGGAFSGHFHTFQFEPNHPATHELAVWWQLGTEVLSGVPGTTLRLCDLQLQPGTYVLVAKVRDDTPWVRSEFIREQAVTSNLWWHITIETPPADRNADGVVSVADLVDFVQDFSEADGSADLTRDGAHDLEDVVAFVRLFTGDCG